jgi:rhodanese-related sulfurtransferase
MKQHAQRFLTLVTESKKRIKELTPQALKDKMGHHEPLCIIDVREESEWPSGHIPNAIHLCKGIIERDIGKIISDEHAQIIVYCSGGFRSALVADSLQQMGYSNIYSLESGLQGWLNAGFGIEI